MQIINGRKLSREILAKAKDEVAILPFVPIFCDVLVGEDPSSLQYVKMKAKTAESVGIKFQNANFPASISTENLIKEIKTLNKIKNMCGIIVQLPLPAHLDQEAILNVIDPKLDVDCLGRIGNNLFFPTALACLAVLESLNLDLNDKKMVVLGQGMLVGKPVTALLKSKGFLPIAVTSGTKNKEEIIKQADVIISGIGQGKYITGDMIKTGAVLIDAGTSELESSLVGDVDLESVKDVASYVSPVPGGVGPVTVAMLLNNVLKVAKMRK